MINPKDYTYLKSNVTGISDRSLDAHLTLYSKYVDQLNAIERAYPLVDWTRPIDGQGPPPVDVQKLLDTPIANLKLSPEGFLAQCIANVVQELQAAGISFTPAFYLGDSGFWTTDRHISVNIPWFLANAALWWLVNDRQAKYTQEEVQRALRHETGHAINYAFELWKRPDWTAHFGDFTQPYKDVYLSDPTSSDYVKYLHRTGEKHYAQKHPDEDWAETFAAWLDPRPGAASIPGPVSRGKLEYVRHLSDTGVLSGKPINVSLGERLPYTNIYQTVGEYLGECRPGTVWSPHSELLRREPYAYNAVVLHETYFDQLAPRAPLGPLIQAAASQAFGSTESWLQDLRAASGSTNGWALTVWDPRRNRIANALVEDHRTGIPLGCTPLIAIDVWEHAYALDYGIRREPYLAAVFHNMAWDVVEQRYARTQASINPVVGKVG